ncbi:hydrolase [uncultured Cocleimonas sp.]|uniref:hydrolase n=1 Tax=uncultured Cocleimonas sp. TaxID=1051587 RepID=UPI002615AFD8|nr:hydrolase [uncultured Cocleimonas sp.]
MLNQENTGLVIVDVQGKLARIVHESEALIRNIQALIQGCQILKLPIVWVEQNPQGLGQTVPELSELLAPNQPLEKFTFNACESSSFDKVIAESGVQQWIVCGIEAHICLYQTALGLLSRNYQVEVVTDGISSRSKANIDLAINKLEKSGASLTSVEMCLYELIKDARKAEFKQILPLIK